MKDKANSDDGLRINEKVHFVEFTDPTKTNQTPDTYKPRDVLEKADQMARDFTNQTAESVYYDEVGEMPTDKQLADIKAKMGDITPNGSTVGEDDVYKASKYFWCWSCLTAGVPMPSDESTCGNCGALGLVEIPGRPFARGIIESNEPRSAESTAAKPPLSDGELDAWVEDLTNWQYGTVYKGYDREEEADTLKQDVLDRLPALKTLIAHHTVSVLEGLLDKLPLVYSKHHEQDPVKIHATMLRVIDDAITRERGQNE